MVTLFFISISIFIVYMSISMLFFGIPKSISDTYYHWEDKGVDLEILFTSFIWGITFPLMVLWIEILPDDWNFIPFIWIFQGDTETGRVSGTYCHFTGNKSGACLFAGADFTNRSRRNLGFGSNRLAFGRCGRNGIFT